MNDETRIEPAADKAAAGAGSGGSGDGGGSGTGTAPTLPAALTPAELAAQVPHDPLAAGRAAGLSPELLATAARDFNAQPSPADPILIELRGLALRVQSMETRFAQWETQAGEFLAGEVAKASPALDALRNELASMRDKLGSEIAPFIERLRAHFGGKV